MKQQKSRNKSTSAHWVGADVAKASFDVALVLAHQHFPATPLSDIPARSFKSAPLKALLSSSRGWMACR